jgi:hypothetical protein
MLSRITFWYFPTHHVWHRFSRHVYNFSSCKIRCVAVHTLHSLPKAKTQNLPSYSSYSTNHSVINPSIPKHIRQFIHESSHIWICNPSIYPSIHSSINAPMSSSSHFYYSLHHECQSKLLSGPSHACKQSRIGHKATPSLAAPGSSYPPRRWRRRISSCQVTWRVSSVTRHKNYGCASELVWTQRLNEKSFASTGDWTPVVQSIVRHYCLIYTSSSR